MTEENKDLIHLQHAHATQYTNTEGKSAWKVRKNITSEDLAELPGELTEAEVFSIMDFARKFEDIAFNTGISYGKDVVREQQENITAGYKRQLVLFRNENERLADALTRLTAKQEV